jgi:hypothetical protein
MTYVAVLSHPQARRPSVAGGDLGGVDPAHTGLLPALTGMIGAALGGFGLWLANRMLGKAAFQNAINDGFAKLTNEIQEERDALRKPWRRQKSGGPPSAPACRARSATSTSTSRA